MRERGSVAFSFARNRLEESELLGLASLSSVFSSSPESFDWCNCVLQWNVFVGLSDVER